METKCRREGGAKVESWKLDQKTRKSPSVQIYLLLQNEYLLAKIDTAEDEPSEVWCMGVVQQRFLYYTCYHHYACFAASRVGGSVERFDIEPFSDFPAK